MTIQELLAATKQIDAADAEILLAHVLDIRREDLLADSTRELTDGELACFREFVSWRADGQPVAQITNKKEFYGLEFFIDEGVLIPRPETELLVEEVLKSIEGEGQRLLEVGTGSGCIAISLKKSAPDLQITATDISEGALAVARQNASQHEVAIDFQLADLMDELEGDWGIIVANLPYIAEDDPELEEAVRQHEPEIALFAAEDGLQLIHKLLEQVAAREKQPQLILLEHGARQGDATRTLAGQLFPEATIETIQDLAGLDRILKIQLN